MERTKITHVIGALAKGGAERLVVDLCNELAKNAQYEVQIVSICANDLQNSFISEIHPKVKYLSFNKKRGFSLNVILSLTKWLRNEQPDIVHSHLNAFEYLSLYLLHFSNTHFFHTIHNVAEEECPNYFIKTFRKFFYRMNKVKPVTISFECSKTYRAYYHLENDILITNGRCELKPTGEYNQLLKQYRPNSNSFLLLHIGRISAEKNQELLIRSVQHFNAIHAKKCKLLLIGEVKDEQLYNNLIQLVDNDPQIEFLGVKNNIVDYLNIADAFCLSSFFEGMPISIIEALSVGCIPVCTAVGGIPQMISHAQTGFLSKDICVVSYYHAIKEALHYPDKEMIKLNGMLAFRLNYHIKTAARNHSDAYLNVLTPARTAVTVTR